MSLLTSATFQATDKRITAWLARYSIPLLRIGLGVIFLWFGALKFFPGMSPAQDLATRTIEVLTLGLMPASLSIFVLAAWECLIGLGLIIGRGMRVVLLLLFAQMAGTVLPIFFFPQEVFLHIPYAPTLEGQYIIKNLVLVAAGLVLGATVRGARIKGE
jgi:uncharacterized membrane protein YphA (DoxX/SURF4 family)